MKYFLISLFFLIGTISFAQAFEVKRDFNSENPTYLEADELFYDKSGEVIIARGNVEVTNGTRILLSDRIIYRQNKNLVEAKGNISLLEGDGNVLFARELEIKDDLKQGIIENFMARFNDGSRIAAAQAVKVNDDVTIFEHVVYSPCPICKKPNAKPLWQVKAEKARIDEEKQKVTYKNAFFEVYGKKVFYTPYFSHPTPDADRKSGLLTPSYSSSSIFGETLSTPLYLNLKPNRDATITPTFTASEGVIVEGEYRELFKRGKLYLKGSATYADERDGLGFETDDEEVRSHIEGEGDYMVTDNWQVGFKGKRASDDTYLQRYGFGSEDVLTSHAYSKNYRGRNYATINALSFQSLREDDDSDVIPYILPAGRLHIESKPTFYNSRFALDADTLVLKRDVGTSTNRASLKGSWNMSKTAFNGHVFDISTSIRGDAYLINDLPSPSGEDDEFKARVVPEAEVKWSYPLAKSLGNKRIIIEPTANIIISPNGNNPSDIQNEDSVYTEISDINLFSNSRFTGLDRVEGGTRISYGMRAEINDDKLGVVDVVVGQSYRSDTDESNLGVNSGLGEHVSDYVGRVGYQINDKFDLAYIFRLDRDDFTARRNTVTAGLDIAPIRFDANYISTDVALESADEVDLEEIFATSTIDLTEKLSLSADARRNLQEDAWRSAGTSLVYYGSCFDALFTYRRDFTRDRDAEPSTTVGFNISLKNLTKK